MKPKVSVVIPVYNGERHICQCVDSILEQSFQDFEIVVVNDGSTDQTAPLLHQYRDDRIRIIENDSNLGITKSRNIALDHARGKYIAVQDSDDYSHRERLKTQVEFLEANPGYAMVASWANVIREDTSPKSFNEIWRFSPDSSCLSAYFLFHNCIVHSSVMVRRDVLPTPAYREFEPAEDYDLWIRLARNHKIQIIRKPLVNYRLHSQNVSDRRSEKQKKAMYSIVAEQLQVLGLSPTEQELEIHKRMLFPGSSLTPQELAVMKKWLSRIVAANDQANVYDPEALRMAVGKHWMTMCKRVCKERPWLFFAYLFSSTGKGHRTDFVLSAFRRILP